MLSGIYKITNIQNGQVYIGSAERLKKRIANHKHALRRGTHHSIKLQRAWNKYGEEAFTFEILFACSKENLIMYEQRCIDGYGTFIRGYNMYPVAGSPIGRVLSEESREKIRRAHLGRKASPETRSKMSAARRGNKYAVGSVRTKEELLRLSKINTGNKYCLGKKASDEVRRNMSIAKIGNKNSVGRVHPPETKAKMAAARKRWWTQRRVSRTHEVENANQAAENNLKSSGPRQDTDRDTHS
jgi:group I intron endonuclease